MRGGGGRRADYPSRSGHIRRDGHRPRRTASRLPTGGPACAKPAHHAIRRQPAPEMRDTRARHDFPKPGTGVPGTTVPPWAPGAAAARGAGARRSGVLRGEAGAGGPPVRGPLHLPSSRKVEAKAEPGGAEPSAAAPPHTARRPRPGRPRAPRRKEGHPCQARLSAETRDRSARHHFPTRACWLSGSRPAGSPCRRARPQPSPRHLACARAAWPSWQQGRPAPRRPTSPAHRPS